MTQRIRRKQTVDRGENDGERASRGGETETVRKSGVKTGERERERKGDGR